MNAVVNYFSYGFLLERFFCCFVEFYFATEGWAKRFELVIASDRFQDVRIGCETWMGCEDWRTGGYDFRQPMVRQLHRNARSFSFNFF